MARAVSSLKPIGLYFVGTFHDPSLLHSCGMQGKSACNGIRNTPVIFEHVQQSMSCQCTLCCNV
jgi:hypothetical protein